MNNTTFLFIGLGLLALFVGLAETFGICKTLVAYALSLLTLVLVRDGDSAK